MRRQLSLYYRLSWPIITAGALYIIIVNQLQNANSNGGVIHGAKLPRPFHPKPKLLDATLIIDHKLIMYMPRLKLVDLICYSLNNNYA